jgi:uncharacterized membrane-anchored protein YjiN (DUF445 family)
MNKSFFTNFIAILVVISGHFSPIYGDLIFMTGMFALSGGITNWLAIHMLFEKVPLLYGSGVIPNRFEDFKEAIKNLIVNQFFTREHIERIVKENGSGVSDSIIKKIDFDRVFIGLSDAIEGSKLGGMLLMVGGKAALEPLREPVILKLKNIIAELAEGHENGNGDNDFTGSLISKVERIIDKRLEELTPENVKRIVEDMIQKHLGWLVVWGGIFGGVLGLIMGLWNT